MAQKRFKKTPLWDWSYNNPKMDQKLTRLHKSLMELDGMLAEKKGKDKKGKKR